MQKTKAERSDVYGFATIADIMTALNPLAGELYLRSLLVQKAGHNMAAIFGAKHPHVHSFVPEAYSAVYSEMPDWGHKRMVSPGVILNDELVTTDLVELNVSVREFVGRGWYSRDWEQEVATDPVGNAIALEHPWNKRTISASGEAGKWDSKYTWVTSPRWWHWKGDGKNHVVELHAPSTLNASGRDPQDQPGPYEEALILSPITEAGDPAAWKGIDIVRTIRSFDPCMGCAVHVHKGN